MEPRITIAAFGGDAHRDMIALRRRVLREPLGLAFTDADLAAERDQLHLALLRGDVVLGTALLVPPDPRGSAKLRQMAVDPGFERRGFGSALVRRGEAELARRGAARIVLAARQPAVGFYERLGYVTQGEPFLEMTIVHVRMVKQLV